MAAERAPEPELDYRGMLEAFLEVPGSVGDTFRRMYQYSTGNCAFFMMQGIEPQPVATFAGWRSVDRWVKKGSKARWVLRPITVKLKEQEDEDGQPKTMTRFKPVRAIFPIEDTEGEPLPEIELPDWSRQRALGALGIREVAFDTFESNVQGFSIGNEFAINPAAKYPTKTFYHEISHICLKHTVPEAVAEYATHRGIKELEAEATGHFTMTELGLMTPEMSEVSRGYCQQWLRDQPVPDRSVRAIFRTTDEIVAAGRITLDESVAA